MWCQGPWGKSGKPASWRHPGFNPNEEDRVRARCYFVSFYSGLLLPLPSPSSCSPVCVRLCLCNSSERVKRFPQYDQVHMNGLSPVCQRKCARRCEVLPYTLPQPCIWQMCCFFLPGSPEPLEARTQLFIIHSRDKNERITKYTS